MRKCNNAGRTDSRRKNNKSVVISGGAVVITNKFGNTIAKECPNAERRFKIARKAAGWPKMELLQVQLRA
jgi:hypothetical protein